MTVKRIILILMTIATIVQIGFSLIKSLDEAQIVNNLELYQNNLVLHITELRADKINLPIGNETDLKAALDSLVGTKPYQDSEKYYQESIRIDRENLIKLQARLDRLKSEEISDPNNIQQQEIQQSIVESNNYLDELNLKLGILQTAANKPDAAIETWQEIINNKNNSNIELAKTASILQNLWQGKISLLEDSEAVIEKNLIGWFRYRSLDKLYQANDRDADRSNLEIREQNIALKSLIQLSIIGLIPVIGGLLGFILFIFLIIQSIVKKEKSILATNATNAWETPWSGEIPWQVLIVGFFFISQFILPILFGSIGLNPAELTLRQKAAYVLVSYLTMAASGLVVLYFSLKKYLPLTQEWFRFKLVDRWFLWGFGGYLVAIPLILIISLINQQIWQGQGGSNPLLFLALKSQDRVALAIFFFTASIAAPIFEEIIFRGFLLPSLSKYVSVTWAIILSSLLFAVAHLSLSEIVPLMTLGIILGTVYTRSRNLLSSIFLHGLWNSGTLISLFILGAGQ
jgi:uncharacterized protein